MSEGYRGAAGIARFAFLHEPMYIDMGGSHFFATA